MTQSAVRPLPRLALWLFCLAYVLPGWLGREPWKSADMAAFGYMQALASGQTAWLNPLVAGLAPQDPGLLPLWLGAAAIWLFGGLFSIDFATRIPFALMLGATFVATWYGCYALARHASAQPVSFAFGGEANPRDYARAVADGALLALIACLGLAQLSHQATIDVAQLCALSAMLCGGAGLARSRYGLALLATGAVGLGLCGAPLLCASLLVVVVLTQGGWMRTDAPRRWRLLLVLCAVLLPLMAWLAVNGWSQRVPGIPTTRAGVWQLVRLWLWFAWPTSVLAAWALWRWRAHWRAPHLSLPLATVALLVILSAIAHNSDRVLMLALPALAMLGAFALPTASRSIAALIDWFTLIFFSGCATVIWVVWVAMQTGVPAQPAANVARLLPGFVPSFGLVAFCVAAAATLTWGYLVRWRVGRHRDAMWTSLVLPAGGAALCWLLLMTLWMPLLDFARSYAPLTRLLSAQMTQAGCVRVHGLTRAQAAALVFYTQRQVLRGTQAVPGEPETPACPYLVIDADAQAKASTRASTDGWTLQATLRRPADDDEDLLLYRR